MRLLLIVTIAVLLYNAAAISRDYQDSWILEGLEIPFLLFVVAFSLTFFSEKRVSLLVVIAVVGRIVFLLIPNLKYVWFQGVYTDQHTQYSLASHVVATGRISTSVSSGTSSFYTASPLFHVLFSIFSIILNVPVMASMKYVPVLFSPIYPLLTYAILKKMELVQKNMILKYALFLSSVPIYPGNYVVIGTTFGIFLAFIALFLLVSMLQKNDRRYLLVCAIFTFALAATHTVTSVILTAFLLLIPGLQRISYFRPKSYLRASVALIVASISLAWLMFPGYSTLGEITRELFIAVPTGTTPSSEYIPSTFFQLANVNMLAAAKTFLAYYGADLFLLILTFAVIVGTLKIRKRLNNAGNFLLLFGGLALVIIGGGVLLKLGATRTLTFERLLFPIFSGIAVFYIGKKRKWIRPIIFVSIILLATLELYGCQPLIPSANVLYKDLPASVPIGYVNEVNSVYQRQVVDFALNHVVGVIASDAITYNQIVGVTEYNFRVTHVINYYPIDKGQPPQEYDLFIIHVPGKSGILGEKAEVRTPDLILQTVYNSSIVYTNGESFILAHSYPQP
jgi:hypothetical protein